MSGRCHQSHSSQSAAFSGTGRAPFAHQPAQDFRIIQLPPRWFFCRTPHEFPNRTRPRRRHYRQQKAGLPPLAAPSITTPQNTDGSKTFPLLNPRLWLTKMKRFWKCGLNYCYSLCRLQLTLTALSDGLQTQDRPKTLLRTNAVRTAFRWLLSEDH